MSLSIFAGLGGQKLVFLTPSRWVIADSPLIYYYYCLQIPLIMLIAEVPYDIIDANRISSISRTPEVQTGQLNVPNGRNSSDSEGLSLSNLSKPMINGNNFVKLIRIDISFMSSTHTGLRTTELVSVGAFDRFLPWMLVLRPFGIVRCTFQLKSVL